MDGQKDRKTARYTEYRQVQSTKRPMLNANQTNLIDNRQINRQIDRQ